MAFGNVIKKLRKERSLTQDQLANLLNVTPQAVSRWETNAAMPDISLLVPLANVFGVSTDTLLEVDVQKNEEHIRDFCENFCTYEEPYGKSVAEKVRIYREEVRKYPHSVELKEILVSHLSIICKRQEPWPNLTLYRELASLTEDIIAAGGGQMGLESYQRCLVEYSRILNDPDRASEVIRNAADIYACKEVLLPLSLSGRAQIEARKDLLFKCADAMIRTVYDLYEENAEELTDAEWAALENAENIVAALYGQAFSNHFVLYDLAYKAVRGSLKKGRKEEAVQRLRRIADKLQFRKSHQPVNSPLVQEQQFRMLCALSDSVCAIQMDAMDMIEFVLKDFRFDDVSAYRKVNPQFDKVCEDLAKLADSSGQERKIDWWAYMDAACKIRDSIPLD